MIYIICLILVIPIFLYGEIHDSPLYWGRALIAMFILLAVCLINWKIEDTPSDEQEYDAIVTDVYTMGEIVDNQVKGVWTDDVIDSPYHIAEVTFHDEGETYKGTAWIKDCSPDEWDVYGTLLKYTYHTVIKVGDNVYEDNSEEAYKAFKGSKGQTVKVNIETYTTEDGNSETRISKINETVIPEKEGPTYETFYKLQEKK